MIKLANFVFLHVVPSYKQKNLLKTEPHALSTTWWQLGVGGGSLRLGRKQNLQNRTEVSAGYTASHAKLLVNCWRTHCFPFLSVFHKLYSNRKMLLYCSFSVCLISLAMDFLLLHFAVLEHCFCQNALLLSNY